jgi:hypothetical protein
LKALPGWCIYRTKGERTSEAAVDELERPRSLEHEIEREWWWLNGALHAIAQVNSGDPGAYWQMLAQKRTVDRKRIEIASKIAELVGPPRSGNRGMRE